ncbi:AMP-binding protein [Pseudonocardia broussonetiae]|uniref:AMP-binding protein n=1 Tax=Pseudonocardia broussonetiae TaxID=2736640 RepID=A0A6M6JCW6_9PSEU|nr:AMP-binding protein [Pseudonocardia broussonetiae]QJY44787.1 AMP-binding protein [Pseudonocardia broussonetiae]
MTAADGASYLRVLVESLTRYPDREALVAGDRRLTYAQAGDLVSRLQQVLHAHGVGRGSSVVTLSPNTPDVLLAQFAVGLNGARYTGLHPLGSVDDHVALCEDAGATVLLAHPDHADTAAAVLERAASVGTVLTFGPTEVGQDLLALAGGVTARPLAVPATSPDDTVWMPYTGGTTGRSKGVMHTQSSMVQGMLSLAADWGLSARPRYLASAPITHASVLPVLPTLARGGTVVLNRGFDPEVWLDTVEREHIDYVFVVPTMLYVLLDQTDPTRHDLSALDTILYGSAPMSASRLGEALDVFGPILMQGYGQTETLAVGTVLRKDEHDPVHRPDLLTSCGRATAGAEVEVLDADGAPLPPGEIGELCMRGGFVMNGYWRRPELTAEAFEHGWLHTGDMAVRDDRGFLHLVDRKKDMIISGAFNIYPREIEDVIAADPSVSSVAVIGVPDPKWGEAVTAVVVARPGRTVDEDVLKAAVRASKGAHQVPKSVLVVDRLPVTAVGKIDKKALRARYWQGMSRAVN